MNWTKASSVAEILSSVAILITLIYLVVEIGQNTTALEATARHEILITDLSYIMKFVDDPELDTLYYKLELTDEEQVRLSTLTLAFIRMRENSWLQYENGVLDEVTWGSYRRSIANVLGPQRMRTWWQRFVANRGVFDPGFISMVDELLAGTPIRDVPIHTMVFD